jgi:hypothetical protein
MIDLNKPALRLMFPYSVYLLAGVINRATAPYVEPFYFYGTLAAVAFVALFWGHALRQRRLNASSSLVLTQG